MKIKRILIVIPIICLLILISFFIYHSSNSFQNNILRVYVIDVGQGDSILITYNNQNILIDSGSYYSYSSLSSFLRKKRVRAIDHLIMTHPHEDHIGSMDKIIEDFRVKNFYGPKVTSNSETFKSLIKALKKNSLKIQVVKQGFSISLEEYVSLYFLSPIDSEYSNLNNYSAVIRLVYGKTSFLFSGDAEEAVEQKLINSSQVLEADILKIGHHGSKTSTSEEFLAAVNPKIAVISCALGNDYGHPDSIVLERLAERNIKVYRTDKQGTISFTSDGKRILASKSY